MKMKNMKIGGHDNYYYERDDERAGEIGGDVAADDDGLSNVYTLQDGEVRIGSSFLYNIL